MVRFNFLVLLLIAFIFQSDFRFTAKPSIMTKISCIPSAPRCSHPPLSAPTFTISCVWFTVTGWWTHITCDHGPESTAPIEVHSCSVHATGLDRCAVTSLQHHPEPFCGPKNLLLSADWFYFILFWPHHVTFGPSLPIRKETHTPCSGRTESQPLGGQRSPDFNFSMVTGVLALFYDLRCGNG